MAAETGGSVDLGDMAETPTIFAQPPGTRQGRRGHARVPTQGLAVRPGGAGRVRHQDAAQLKGQTIAVQEGTVEQYVLIGYLKKAASPTATSRSRNLPVTSASAAVVGR